MKGYKHFYIFIIILAIEHFLFVAFVINRKFLTHQTCILSKFTPKTVISVNNDTLQNPHYYLFLLIITSVDASERRVAIRETWLKNRTSSQPIGYRFVIGKYGLNEEILENLAKENSVYGDILALDYPFTDTYENLSHKVMNAITWAGQNVRATYVMKTDDDVYINLDYLLERLNKESTNIKLVIYGDISDDAVPLNEGKWSEKNWTLCPNYFPYPSGIGYIVSSGVVKFISENYKRLKSYKNEDVSLGNWLAPTKVQIKVFDGMERDFIENACHWWLMHRFSSEKLRSTYEFWITNHTLCSK